MFDMFDDLAARLPHILTLREESSAQRYSYMTSLPSVQQTLEWLCVLSNSALNSTIARVGTWRSSIFKTISSCSALTSDQNKFPNSGGSALIGSCRLACADSLLVFGD